MSGRVDIGVVGNGPRHCFCDLCEPGIAADRQAATSSWMFPLADHDGNRVVLVGDCRLPGSGVVSRLVSAAPRGTLGIRRLAGGG